MDVFQQARLGPLTLRNRIIKAATFEGMARNALVSDELIAFHRAHAAGGAAMTTVADIERVTAAHATAAELALRAGFDAVEIHLGHNYFASSFLSPRLNRRRDAYGGSLANRVKVALGAARAVRDAVGDRVAVLAKLNMEDGVRGGLEIEESLQVARWLERDGSVDALELTCGSSLLNTMYLFRGEAPLREFATFRQPMRLGVELTGGRFIRAYPYQEAYLLDSARRFRARALLREPDLVNRLRADPATRSLCVHCNKCMPTIFTGTRCVLA
ncbi:hypothetical protein AB0C28_45770 [Nonomuraea sp. NPDC048892]|uniref:oxidoreductase n=2 Tax=unclassified Nonomuraea TaxID=2593643 RepID=UPI0033FBF0AB